MNHPFFRIMEERQGVRLMEQHGEDLGARMAQAFSSLFAQGYQQVVLVGTDLPVLPATHCTQAFSLLNTHDLVLGPSTDGGYYLIGLRRPVPDLFVGIPWSTEHVFEKTQALATHLGLQMSLLPQVRDLDTADDLLAVIEDTGLLQSKNCPPSLTNRTASVLRMLHERLTAWPEESE
jgi:rSAM/selenodomain-associated transferase 1